MLKSIAFLTAVSMVCGFNPDILERETTESYEDQGFHNYEYYHSFNSGTFNDPGSLLDGCLKYTTINDIKMYDLPEIHENYDTLVVGSDIAPGYMSELQRKYGKDISEYSLLCPLETSTQCNLETKELYKSENYIMKAVWQEAPEIEVFSKDQNLPINLEKLKEIIPDAYVYRSFTQNNNEGCVFFISTNPSQNLTFATELDYVLTEDDIKSVIECKKDNLASVKFNGNWYSDRIYLPVSPDFSVDELETVTDFLTSKNVEFTVTDYEDNKHSNRKIIVFDNGIPAAEYLALDCELAEKTGITFGQLSMYESDHQSIPNNSIEYFDIIMGDANDDGKLLLNDAILIMQAVGNPDEYHLTPQGKYNADIFNHGDGITNNDALAIQQYLLGITDHLPASSL